MSRRYKEVSFEDMLAHILGISKEIVDAFDEVQRKPEKKEERKMGHSHGYSSGHSYGHSYSHSEGRSESHSDGCSKNCSHSYSSGRNKSNPRFVNLEKDEAPVTTGKQYESRNHDYYQKLRKQMRESKEYQKNVQIYVSQILDKLEKNMRSLRCDYVRCLVTPVEREYDVERELFDVEVAKFCLNSVIESLKSRNLTVTFNEEQTGFKVSL